MHSRTSDTLPSPSHDEGDVRVLYRALLERWNERNAEGYAALCLEDAHIVGFDGSQMDGRAQIADELAQIFAHHPTAAYVAKVRGVDFLAVGVAVLRAVAGMIPPGKADINPAVNAIQTLVAAKRDGRWQVALFHNTPAAFHGRPELGEKLTDELRRELESRA
jgi:uncharacterized protein (TIGR02246 family)